MKNRKVKPIYLRVRLPMIRQTGGAHQAAKGGKYRRGQEKQKTRKEIGSEIN